MVRFIDSGDESDVQTDDGLAPVTPLFGRRASDAYPKTAAEVQRALEDRLPAPRTTERSAPPAPHAPASPTPWLDDSVVDHAEPASPPADDTIVDISGRRPRPSSTSRASRRPQRGDAGPSSAEAGELGLLKRLRARQLSISEAGSYLRQLDLGPDTAQAILDTFVERGYLDDARLAEQVVHVGVDRKGQGRQVIAQTLAKRGVPREVADAALGALPDDDADRALEFARTKAGSMRALERDVALRRLAGQLARRGYGGSVALDAARTALDELSGPSGRVRFDES